MKEKWVNDIERKLADYRKPAPQGLWEDIEKAMAKEKKTMPLSRKIYLWTAAFSGVAALLAVVLLVGGTPPSAGTSPSLSSQSAPMASADAGGARPSVQLQQAAGGEKPEKRVLAHAGRRSAVQQGAASRPSVSRPSADVPRQPSSGTPLSPSSPRDASSPAKKEPAEVRPEHRQPDAGHTVPPAGREPRQDMLADAYIRPAKKRKLRMTLSATNLLQSSSRYGGYGALIAGATPPLASTGHDAGQNELMKVIQLENQGKEIYTKKKHRLPVRVGMSLQYPLSGRLGIESGLTYSYHSSQLTSGSEIHRYEMDQSLQFIGIPLNLNFSMWENERFGLYLSGGGMMEMCVAGKSDIDYIVDNELALTKHKNIRVKPLQFSVNASAGFQVNLIPQLGVYLEPGVSYYFDNGSAVETIYKDKPLNFNLKMGLRYTF